MENDTALAFTVETPESRDAQRLIQQLDEELYVRYPQHAVHRLHASEATNRQGIFVVARIAGQAVGCGAVRPLRGDIGGVKRMFVETGFRGRNIGRKILETLETAARGEGFKALRLETGTRQHRSEGSL
jgi:putative acetyltransferase